MSVTNDNTIVDWNGQTISEGDTILYAASGFHGLTYGVVAKITKSTTKVEKRKYNTPTGNWEAGATVSWYEVEVPVVKVVVRPKVGPNKIGKAPHTINSRLHPYAFPSITKFEAAIDD